MLEEFDVAEVYTTANVVPACMLVVTSEADVYFTDIIAPEAELNEELALVEYLNDNDWLNATEEFADDDTVGLTAIVLADVVDTTRDEPTVFWTSPGGKAVLTFTKS